MYKVPKCQKPISPLTNSLYNCIFNVLKAHKSNLTHGTILYEMDGLNKMFKGNQLKYECL